MWLVVQKFLDLILLLHCWKKQSTLFSFSPFFSSFCRVPYVCFSGSSFRETYFFLSPFLSWKENIHIVSHLGGEKTKQWCLCRWLLTDEEVTPFFFFSFRLVSLLCVVVVSSLCLWQKKSWIFESRVRFFFLFCLGFCQSAQTNKQPQVFLFLVVTRSF